MTANCFGAAICTTKLVRLIQNILGQNILHLLINDENMRKKVAEFKSKFGLTQAFGCIDGAHVPIQCPIEHSQDFFLYKQFYSRGTSWMLNACGLAVYMKLKCLLTLQSAIN